MRAVAFDLGETLVDETRYWSEWATRLGTTPLTLCALLGAAIVRGEHHRSVLERAGATPETAPPGFSAADLYPDARAALESLRDGGVEVAIAGNFTREIADDVRTWGLAADLVASGEELGAEKPDPAFFLALADRLAVPPGDLAYVGDRVDNDVLGARAAGCRAAFLRRGPWALLGEPMLPDDVPVLAGLADVLPLLPTRK